MLITLTLVFSKYRYLLIAEKNFMMNSQFIYHMVILMALFGKFGTGVFWYRFFAKGNLIQLTGHCLVIRVMYDIVVILPLLFAYKAMAPDDFQTIYNLLIVSTLLMELFIYRVGYVRA